MMQGISVDLVERAIESGDPFPGGNGFAGQLRDGRAARDVLGRYPLFTEENDYRIISLDPTTLDTPHRVPPGAVRSEHGDEHIWSLPDPDPNETGGLEQLRTAINESLRETDGDDGLAVAFSGGVDSALVAQALPDAPLYVAGFSGSHDIAAAKQASRLLDRAEDLHIVRLTQGMIRDYATDISRATGRTSLMDLAIATPLFAVARRASADGYNSLALGQGADELFGGYEKVAQAPTDSRVDADGIREATSEVLAGLPDQLERDVLALRRAGVEPVLPFLSDSVVHAAIRLPERLLVNRRGERKVALRKIAREFLPDKIAFRKKQAAQYGTDVNSELKRVLNIPDQ
jgi:asparagine synthase (glutamine-hydrolysing)